MNLENIQFTVEPNNLNPDYEIFPPDRKLRGKLSSHNIHTKIAIPFTI